MVISSPLVANVLPIINLPMALGNLPIAANGLQLVPIDNDTKAMVNHWELLVNFSVPLRNW